MNKRQETKDLFLKLEPWDRTGFMLDLMNSGDLKFHDVSEAYIQHLEGQRKVLQSSINKAGFWITNYYAGGKLGKSLFTKVGSAYWLLKSGTVRGTNIEKELRSLLEENPYHEDEYGYPISNIRP